MEVFEERLDKVCIACENDAVGTNSDIETRGRVDEDLLELGHVANANGDVETLGGEAGLGEDLVELLDRGDLHLVHVGLRVKPAMKECKLYKPSNCTALDMKSLSLWKKLQLSMLTTHSRPIKSHLCNIRI